VSNRTYRKVTGALRSTWAANLNAAVRLLPTVGSVQNLVAFPTKRDQVGLCVVTNGAPSSHVVNRDFWSIHISGSANRRVSRFLREPSHRP